MDFRKKEHRRTEVLGKRSWIYRYPKAFQITFLTFGLAIFFSKPIYDIIYTPRIDLDFSEPPTTLSFDQKEESNH